MIALALPGRPIFLRLALAAAAAFGLWAAGLAWFVHLADLPPDLPAHADGIVALTGGADRVETALRLLAEDRANLLLLSGIGGGAELAPLARRAGLDPAPLASRVTLGRGATSTRGNATETAAWVRANDIHSLILVTAFYHMPRALTELERELPGVTLSPLPIRPGALHGETGMIAPRLILEEYTKFIAARLGLTSRTTALNTLQHGHSG
jgi:uncharacterized SAM-binding protein YcdF (DUF218 family)